MSNLALWDAVEATPPEHTKAITHGFRGTAINPQSIFKRVTEQFGPCGKGWGYTIDRSELIEGGPLVDSDGNVICMQKVHTCHLIFWYLQGGQRYEIPGVGHTPFITKSKHGFSCDMEYEKKSVTDALTKAMSMLGFGADIRMGMFDEPGYVDEMRAEHDEEQKRQAALKELERRESFLKDFNASIEKMKGVATVFELEHARRDFQAIVDARGRPDEKTSFKAIYQARLRDLNKEPEAANG